MTAASNPVACPKYHLSAVHITDKSNADDIDELLAVIGAEVQEGLPLLSLTGQPGIGHMIWSALPMVLSCTCLPILPELNPMETVSDDLKSNFHAKRVFENIEEIKANTQRTWQAFIKDPELMKSIMHRKWVAAPET